LLREAELISKYFIPTARNSRSPELPKKEILDSAAFKDRIA